MAENLIFGDRWKLTKIKRILHPVKGWLPVNVTGARKLIDQFKILDIFNYQGFEGIFTRDGEKRTAVIYKRGARV